MSKTLFESSKAALAFAGLTIAGTIFMIGTDEGGGMLGRALEQFQDEREPVVEEVKAAAKKDSVPAADTDPGLDPEAGWGVPSETFTQFEPVASEDEEEEDASEPGDPRPTGGWSGSDRPAPRSVSRKSGKPKMAPPPVMPDYPGTPVPRGGQSEPRGEPVITDREVTITPE